MFGHVFSASTSNDQKQVVVAVHLLLHPENLDQPRLHRGPRSTESTSDPRERASLVDGEGNFLGVFATGRDSGVEEKRSVNSMCDLVDEGVHVCCQIEGGVRLNRALDIGVVVDFKSTADGSKKSDEAVDIADLFFVGSALRERDSAAKSEFNAPCLSSRLGS